ncbi:MAG: phytanoyl-CoA dioxygenase family protein [Candidatus Latescibacteria bacterium]|nr:phytanoyl-CoA dioxygenase family protein [Candidatus Latescibacterota bacterium]
MAYEQQLVPSRLNPDLNPEQQREVEFFRHWGYLVVEQAITPAQVALLRQALDEVVARQQSEFTHQLLEQDDRFAFLIDHQPVLSRIRAILGNCIQLHSATARVTSPGQPDQDWHRDGPWPMDFAGTPYGSLPGQINCAYFLDDLTPENGPNMIVPGSHRVPFRPPLGHPTFPDEKQVFAKAGDVVMFDGWLYHRGGANNSWAPRRGCFMCYQNAWMKSREPFDGPRVKKLREEGPPERQMLLGGVGPW